MTLNLPPPPDAPCTPHPSLAPCARQLDHWFKTQTLLFQQVQDLFRCRIFSVPSLPFIPSVPSSTPDHLRPQVPTAPPQADPPSPSPPPRPSDFGLSSDFGLRISDFIPPPLHPLQTLLTLHTLHTLPTLSVAAADPNILKPLLDWEKLLLKHAQLVLACQKLQNKAARPGEPEATDTQDGPPDNSQAIALMRKTFFADIDEYERSGRLKIPPAAAQVLGDAHGFC